MNVITAVQMYITKMTEDSGPGMKIFLMDKETTSIISMVYSQSEIMQREVYLLERIDAEMRDENDNGLRHLKCLVFLRPTHQNISLLCNELRNPKYGSYYIYFSNIVSKADVKMLAECDEQEVVREVQELYADYLAINSHIYSLGISKCVQGLKWNKDALDRSVQGITALLLSLKKNPVVRFQANSELCKRLGERIRDVVNIESTLFDFRQTEASLLLLLDRRDDPVTPLLNQWTYQAMVHELLTISNNRVNLSNVSGISKELQEVVLSAEQDDFYAENLYKNFGEIGQTIKELMEKFQENAKKHQKVESIADMRLFVEMYPQFKKMSGTVSKHVTVVGELSSMVSRYNLLEISEVEQEIASQGAGASGHFQSIKKLLSNTKVRDIDAVRLVLLFALRYEKSTNNDIVELVSLLRKRGTPENLIKAVGHILEYGGTHARQGEVFNKLELNAVKITKRFFKGLNGVENVYTQHVPLVYEILEELQKNRLRDTQFPHLTNQQTSSTRRYQDIIVFIVGGITYEEALAVHTFNKENPSTRVVLGGTYVHNMQSFLQEIETATQDSSRRNIPHNLRNVLQKSELSRH